MHFPFCSNITPNRIENSKYGLIRNQYQSHFRFLYLNDFLQFVFKNSCLQIQFRSTYIHSKSIVAYGIAFLGKTLSVVPKSNKTDTRIQQKVEFIGS